MRRSWKLLLLWLLVVTVGCGDQLYLENTEIVLIIGLDRTENGETILYSFRPLFEKGLVKTYEITKVKETNSLRAARKKVSTITSGYLNTRKLQLVLLSKDLLKHKNIYHYLNELYRDPKSELNAKIAVFDGSMEEVSRFPWQEKGKPGMILPRILEQALANGTALVSTLSDYQRQLLDSRMTPYMTEFYRYHDHIRVKGTSLLGDDGKYTLLLGLEESSYLFLLRNELKKSLSLQFKHVGVDSAGRPLGVEVQKSNTTITTELRDHRPFVRVDLDIEVDVTERPFFFPSEDREAVEEMEDRISEEMKRKLSRLIKKLQHHQVDPVGFGFYLHAQQYDWWKQHKTNWPKVFSEVKFEVNPKVNIEDHGSRF